MRKARDIEEKWTKTPTIKQYSPLGITEEVLDLVREPDLLDQGALLVAFTNRNLKRRKETALAEWSQGTKQKKSWNRQTYIILVDLHRRELGHAVGVDGNLDRLAGLSKTGTGDL